MTTPDPLPLPTVAEIEESLKICEAATDGPWMAQDYTELPEGYKGVSVPGIEVFLVPPGYMGSDNDGDAEFIAHARTALPLRNRQLLALLEPVMEYGLKHKTGCPACAPWPEPVECTCGLDAKLRELGLKE